MSYEDAYWSEVRNEESPLERERADRELRDSENEQRRDREIPLEDDARKKAT